MKKTTTPKNAKKPEPKKPIVQKATHHEAKTEIVEGAVPVVPTTEKKPEEKKGWFGKSSNKKQKKPSPLDELKVNEKHFKKKSRGLGQFSFRGFLKNIRLQETMELAGFENSDPKKVNRNIIKSNVLIALITLAFLGFKAYLNSAYTLDSLMFLAGATLGVFSLGLIFTWTIFLFYLDMAIYQRTKEVEKVFPDFLQLASSNISAGMPIDRALWYAVRPNFGVLSKEIETVAKNTLAGQDLSEALTDFSKKYNSKVIQRSISLVLEGLAAGGELADLLNKIAIDIEETRLLKQDMAANVTTYVIFITFAAIIAAPALLGLSTQLLEVISRITASMASQSGGSSSSTGFFTFSTSSNAISVGNFQIFAYTMLTISSIFAACIVNVIQKGRVKDGLSKIPIFIIVSLLIYFASSTLMGMLFVGLV